VAAPVGGIAGYTNAAHPDLDVDAVFGPTVWAAPDGCNHPEPETLRTQSPMKVSLPTPPAPLQGESPYPPAELAQSLDQEMADTLAAARADLALLNRLPLSAAERDLAEELHGAIAHAAHLAARLRDLTESTAT
jgi:hypothetical protein